MIEETSLQLHVSALAHCPESCYVRKYFEHNIPKSIVRLPTVSKEWGSLQQTHHDDGDPEDICLSPDGKLVASSTVRVWETATGTLLKTFDTSRRRKLVKFSLDGKHFICLLQNATLRVWNVATRLMVKEIKGSLPKDSHVSTGLLSVLRDRSLAVFGQADGTIQMIDVENETTSVYVSNSKTSEKNRSMEIKSLVLSYDATLLASCQRDELQIWDTRTGSMRKGFNPVRLKSNLMGPRMAFSPGSSLIASVRDDGTILVWVGYTDCGI